MCEPRVSCIVEGHGEVDAIPALLRRVGQMLEVPVYPNVLHPIRIPVSKLVKEGELEKAVELAARKSGNEGLIFILLDCDDDCPAELGPALMKRAVNARPDRAIALVLAKREYEAWFIASIVSLRGQRGILHEAEVPDEPEEIRDAKGWLSRNMREEKKYSETLDQAALTTLFDLDSARSADSFDKCYREIETLFTNWRRVNTD